MANELEVAFQSGFKKEANVVNKLKRAWGTLSGSRARRAKELLNKQNARLSEIPGVSHSGIPKDYEKLYNASLRGQPVDDLMAKHRKAMERLSTERANKNLARTGLGLGAAAGITGASKIHDAYSDNG